MLVISRDAFESNMSLCIFRNRNDGLDQSANMLDCADNVYLQLPDLVGPVQAG
jgi:hypothetical protein